MIFKCFCDYVLWMIKKTLPNHLCRSCLLQNILSERLGHQVMLLVLLMQVEKGQSTKKLQALLLFSS